MVSPPFSIAPSANLLPALDAKNRRFIAFRINEDAAEIVSASPRREWMDETIERFSYRCLPLVIANQLGWDLLNPVAFRARWLGGDSPNDLQVQCLDTNEKCQAISLFGHGILTFSSGSLFRTPPGVSLLVTGPLNAPKDGIYPLSGVVEADWTNATFTMNYRITRPGHWVEFAEGEPFCRLIPLSLDLPESLTPEIAEIDDDPKLAESFRQWSKSRNAFNQLLDNPWSSEAKVGWQKEYFQGRQKTGEKNDRHRTQLHQREFGGQRKIQPKLNGTATTSTRVVRRDAEHFLWHETDLFYNRRQKCAQVLVGLAQTLRRRQPLKGEEDTFLASFDRLLEIDPAIFSDVWQEPRAYFWTRMAFQLTDAVLNGAALSPLAESYYRELKVANLAAGLKVHLDRFREFEIAAAILAGRDWQDQMPLLVDLPWAIPATNWCVEGEGSCEVLRFRDGEIHLRLDQEAYDCSLRDSSRPLVRTPVVEHAGCQLRLQPQSLAGLGIEPVDAVLAEGDDYATRHTELIRDALAAIERYVPHVFEQISGAIRIVGLKSGDGSFTNVSFSELPGAMLLSVVNHPLVMADRIIHEFHHNRLFHIEDCGSLFDSQSPAEENYYSPWRIDRRPLKGILHGLYVYIAVGRFWLEVHRQGELSREDRTLTNDQLMRVGMQIRLARDELAQYARLTPPGEGLFAQICADVDELNAHISATRLPGNLPAVEVRDDGSIVPQCSSETGRPISVQEAIEEHRRAFAPTN